MQPSTFSLGFAMYYLASKGLLRYRPGQVPTWFCPLWARNNTMNSVEILAVTSVQVLSQAVSAAPV